MARRWDVSVVLLAPPGHGDVMKVGTSQTPERRRGFSQSGSRDGLLDGSPDGWFSCSKTTDSAKQAIT